MYLSSRQDDLADIGDSCSSNRLGCDLLENTTETPLHESLHPRRLVLAYGVAGLIPILAIGTLW